jgi:hypothetical protein
VSMSQLPTVDDGARQVAPASCHGGDGTPGGLLDPDSSTMLDSTDHSSEPTPGPVPKRANAAEQARMLQIENAALIDGLRALNEQVKRLEAERSHLLEAGSVRSQEQEVRPPSTNSWASRSRSGELANVCAASVESHDCLIRGHTPNQAVVALPGCDLDVFPRQRVQ